MKFLKNWFDKGFSEEPKQKQVRPERRAVPGLEAIHWTGSSPGLDIVKNISSTGMYLVTRERWPQGEVHPIRLVYEEMTDDSPATHVTVEAKSVRWGEDGMGLAFLLPEAMDLWLWKTDGLVEPEDILSEFRLARALAFLTRICPQATHDLKLLFREGLSNIRIAQAIRILNRTEAMLAAEPDFHRLHAPESVVLRVVKEGSWAEDPTTQQLWIVSLIAAIVVVLVVAVVLELIVRTAHQINELVQQIWYGGTRIAQNTVTLALLRDTNDLAGKILGSASEIAKAASRIRQRTSAP